MLSEALSFGSAEEFIKQHSKAQKQKQGQNSEVRTYDLKFYRSMNEIAKEMGISRQTVAKRMGDLGFHMVWVHGDRYYVKDEDIIKFAFYILNRK